MKNDMIDGEELRQILARPSRRPKDWRSIGDVVYMVAFASVAMVIIWLFLLSLIP
jgi:hypothetical protein